MRIVLDSMQRAEMTAEAVAKAADVPINKARMVAARMYGYSDWRALEQATQAERAAGSVAFQPDQVCGETVIRSRFHFQVHQVAQALDIDTEEAEGIVNLAQPTGYLPGQPFADPAAGLFPGAWTSQSAQYTIEDRVAARAHGVAAGYRLLVEVGSAQGDAYLKRLADANPKLAHHLDTQLGVRIFVASTNEPDPSQDPGAPCAILALRLTALCDQNVIHTIEIEFLPGFCQIDTSDACRQKLVEAVLGYLDRPALYPFHDGPLSGAIDGLTILLKGRIVNVGLQRLYDELMDALEALEEQWDHFDMDMLAPEHRGPGRMPYPLLEVMDITTTDLSEDDEMTLQAIEIENRAKRVVSAIQDIMLKAPTHLARYLAFHGKQYLAPSVLHHDLDTAAGVRAFTHQVQKLEQSGSILQSIGFFLQNHFVEQEISNMVRRGASLDASAKQMAEHLQKLHIEAANALDMPWMASRYESMSVEEIIRANQEGMVLLLMSDDEDDDESDDDSSSMKPPVLLH